MASLDRVISVGNLGKSPEVQHALEERFRTALDEILIEECRDEASACDVNSVDDERVCSFNFSEEVDRYFDDSSLAVDGEPVAVIITGGVAAGKTTLRRQNYSHGYVLIDAPEIFISLSQGEYLPFPGPIEEPMNMIGQYVINQAIRERRNIVAEVIGADVDVMKRLIDSLAGIGYKVNVMYVNCSVETAMERNENRSEDTISAYYAEKFHLEWILDACMETPTGKSD
jgi:dephospho-CoA kinase